MKRVALLFLALAMGCEPSQKVFPDPFKTSLGGGPDRVTSLDVALEFEQDPNAQGCVALVDGKLPSPDVPGDYCPTSGGTPLEPLLYQTGRKTRVYVTVTAIGTTDEYPYPVDGTVTLSPSFGTIFSGGLVSLEGGIARHQRVLLLNTPGHVQIWAESATPLRKTGDASGARLPATFSMGASELLWLGAPTMEDVQRTDNDATSPLHGQRIHVGGNLLMVTRIGGNGFNVEDVVPDPSQKKWNAVFAFAFNGVESLLPGSRLIKLGGAVTSFQGYTQIAEPEYAIIGGDCAPRVAASRYGTEREESEDGAGNAIKARCPENAKCINRDGRDRCLLDNDPYDYDRYGRIMCQTPTTCGQSSSECPAGTQCLERPEWDNKDAAGNLISHTCQACPLELNNNDLWTTSCGPIFRGDEPAVRELKLRNEQYEGALVRLNNVRVQGLNLSDDFFRSGFEGFGQWKVTSENGNCATVVSNEADAQLDVVSLNARSAPVQSFTGTLRQVRFNSGSAFWMVDLRHKEDLILASE